jgi:hypothetical protein
LILLTGDGFARIALKTAANGYRDGGRAERKTIGVVKRKSEAQLDCVAFAKNGEVANRLGKAQRGRPRRSRAGASESQKNDASAGKPG